MKNATYLQGDVPFVFVEDAELASKVISNGKRKEDNVIKHGESGNKHVLEMGSTSELKELDGVLYLVVKEEAGIGHESHLNHTIKAPEEKPSVYRIVPEITEYDPLEDVIKNQRD